MDIRSAAVGVVLAAGVLMMARVARGGPVVARVPRYTATPEHAAMINATPAEWDRALRLARFTRYGPA